MALGKWKNCLNCGWKMHRTASEDLCERCLMSKRRKERRDNKQA